MINTDLKDISILILLKLGLASLLFYFLGIVFKQNLFLYPDFTTIYSNCSQFYSNIFYTQILCAINLFDGSALLPSSNIAIALAALINIFVIVSYYQLSKKYLNRSGQILFILMLALHPYMAIYFFRFYTEVFASLGILLIFFYGINNRKVDLLFIFLSIFLMNTRNGLIPVFFLFGIIEIVKSLKNNNDNYTFLLILLISCLISYIPVSSFSKDFAELGAYFNIIENVFYTFGFRESVAIDGIGILLKIGFYGYLQLIIGLLFIIIHLIGLLGLLKFSIKINSSILSILIYLIIPIFVISHMRYLLPLMPLILLGFCMFFYKKKPI
jgi:hypothetical protein